MQIDIMQVYTWKYRYCKTQPSIGVGVVFIFTIVASTILIENLFIIDVQIIINCIVSNIIIDDNSNNNSGIIITTLISAVLPLNNSFNQLIFLLTQLYKHEITNKDPNDHGHHPLFPFFFIIGLPLSPITEMG